MTKTKEELNEMLEAAKPLMKLISFNCHPHCHVVVDNLSVELHESVGLQITHEFIKD